MTTTYEFVVEALDWYEGCGDDPDIIDTSGWDTLPEAHAFALTCDEPWRIALRRDTGSDEEGITERYYAYADETGKLGALGTGAGLEDGPDLPKRFADLTIPIDTRERTK